MSQSGVPVFERLHAYEGPYTFCRAPQATDGRQADIAVIGMPQSMGHPLYRNQHWAPKVIREASCMFGTLPRDWPWECSLMDEYKVVDCGDVRYATTVKSSFLTEAADRVESLARDGASILSMGGDHMSSEPLMNGLQRVHGDGWGLIHIDAHDDLLELTDSELESRNCGNMFRLYLENGFLDPSKTFQLGLRTVTDPENEIWARKLGVNQLDVFRCEDLGPAAIAEMILEAIGDAKTLISMDIDGFDPGECGAGQASPHPGGLKCNWVRRLFQGIRGLNVRAADFVEIDPVKGMEGRTSTNLAALLLIDAGHLMGLARTKRGERR